MDKKTKKTDSASVKIDAKNAVALVSGSTEVKKLSPSLIRTPENEQITYFSTQLHHWGLNFGRKGLPWQVKDPYKVWVSEIMLQQTQVQTVKEYYKRFFTRFPTIKDLANASEKEVLEQWAGLGYYTRGRNLLKAAQMVQSEFQGIFPNKRDTLIQLPGVGKSTAAAIASICFSEPVSILDANALRLITRYLGITQDVSKQANIKKIWEIADMLVYANNTQLHTQTLMDLGALVCTPKSPKCNVCPLKMKCRAKMDQTIESIPFKNKVKKERVKRDQTWYLLTDKALSGVWLFEQKGVDITKSKSVKDENATNVWQGLMCCPTEQTLSVLNIKVEKSYPLGGMVHKFSHFDLDFNVKVVVLNDEQERQCQIHQGQKIKLNNSQRLAVPKPVQWALNQFNDRHLEFVKKIKNDE